MTDQLTEWPRNEIGGHSAETHLAPLAVQAPLLEQVYPVDSLEQPFTSRLEKQCKIKHWDFLHDVENLPTEGRSPDTEHGPGRQPPTDGGPPRTHVT